MSRVGLPVALGAITLLSAGGCRRASTPHDANTPGAHEARAVLNGRYFDLLHATQSAATDTPENALQLAALVYGPLPGVASEAGAGETPFCAHEAGRTIDRHLARFSPEQRAALGALRRPGRNVAASIVGAARQGYATARVQAIVQTFNSNEWFGRWVQIPTNIEVNVIDRPYLGTQCCAAAEASVGLPSAESQGQQLTAVNDVVYFINFAQSAFDQAPGPAFDTLAAHELFHLAQRRAFQGTSREFSQNFANGGVRSWQLESAAGWVGLAYTRGTYDSLGHSWYDEYLHDLLANNRRQPMPTGLWQFREGSTYSAACFLDYLAGAGAPIRERIIPAIDATSDGDFLARLANGYEGALATAAAGAMRNPSYGAAFSGRFPFLPADVTDGRTARTVGPLGPGPARVERLPQYAQINVRVPFEPATDVVLVTATGFGTLSFQGAATHAFSRTASQTYCRRVGGCACPPGSAAPATIGVPPDKDLIVAMMTDFAGDGSYTLRGMRLDEYCASPPAPPPSGALDPCLTAHRWVLEGADAQRYMTGNFPSNIAITQTHGRLVYAFTAPNAATVTAENFGIVASPGAVAMRGLSMHVDVTFEGELSGRVDPRGELLHFHDSRGAFRPRTQTVINGHATPVAAVPVDTSTFGSSLLGVDMTYSCSATQVTFTRVGATGPGSTVTLRAL